MRLAIICFVACLWISCAPSVRISSDYDKQADFKKYKTYAFTKETYLLNIDPFNRERIMRAVDSGMVSKGFAKSENPDVLVDLTVKAVQKTEAYATSSGMYGGPWGYGYGMGFTTTQINYDQYVEGTLFINMVDNSTQKIFWQGRGTKIIDPELSAERREVNIINAVKRIFTLYPPAP